MKWYKTNGLAPRYKKSGGRRKDPRFLSHDDIKQVVSFIENYAEDHAIVLPGRIPGFKKFHMKLLPSSVTKSSVFRLYHTAMQLTGKKIFCMHGSFTLECPAFKILFHLMRGG